MEYNFLIHKDFLELTLKGRFTYSDNKSLGGILDDITNRHFKKVIINFSAVDYIDSEALAILKLTREKCKKVTTELVLQNPKGQVKQMFDISCFSDLFALDNKTRQ